MAHTFTPAIDFKAIVRLASPILVANLAIMGLGAIDTIMAGQLGAEHLAAVAVGSSVLVMVLISLVGILQSLSPIVGHHFGAKAYERIGFELTQALWLSIPVTLLGLGVVLQTDFWIGFCHLEGRVASLTRDYLIAGSWGIPAFVFGRPFIALNAAVDRAKITMYVSLALLVCKVPVNAVFMYGLFGCPAMGGAGAAMATSVNGWWSFLAYVAIWKLLPYFDVMRSARFYAPQLRAIGEQLRIGVPIAFCTFFEVSSFTMMSIFIARIGTIDVAAHQIVGNVTATIFQIPFSLGIAASVLVAQCCGARRADLARAASLRTLRIAIALATLTSLLLLLFRAPLSTLYSSDIPVQEMAKSLLIFGVIYHVSDAIQTVSAFSLRGYKVTFLPMVIYGVLLWAVGIGGGYWLGFHATGLGGPFGAYGFWAATGTGLVLASIALCSFMLCVSSERKRAIRKFQSSETASIH